MVEFVLPLLAAVRVFFSTRRDTALEVLALRQQVAVLKRNRPRPLLNSFDRLFWTTLRRLWPRRADLLVVKPETFNYEGRRFPQVATYQRTLPRPVTVNGVTYQPAYVLNCDYRSAGLFLCRARSTHLATS